MSNSLQATPPIWVIDTASSTAVSKEWIRIQRIRWVGGTSSSAGDECLVEDAAGNIIFDEFATGAEYETFDMTLDPNKGKSFLGLKVPTLAHGKVYIYLA